MSGLVSMKLLVLSAAVIASIVLAAGSTCEARTVVFSGYTWTIKSGLNLGPGPNAWDPNNVWVDERGDLHLKLTGERGLWRCAGVELNKRLGYGRYQFWVIGPIDKLDPYVVFGLFSYPTRDVGPDGTNEIDIEFAKWGGPEVRNGNYTVWPATKGIENAHSRFTVKLNGDYTTHRFTWSATSVTFESLTGHRDDDSNKFAEWLFQPPDPQKELGHQPMPVEINLWLFRGQPPRDGREVELIIHSFKFTPLR